MSRWQLILFVALATAIGAASCKEANPDFCDDQASPCQAGLVCYKHKCETVAQLSDAGVDLAGIDLSVPDLTVTGPPDLLPMCTSSKDCPAAKPICDAQTHDCRACASASDDSECSVHSVTKQPRCDSTAGKCVTCLLSNQQDSDCKAATTPICSSGNCRACKTNSECKSLVCNDDGTCAAEVDVVYVDHKDLVVADGGSGAPQCTGASHMGTAADPYCEVSDAVKNLAGKMIIHVAGSSVAYTSVVLAGANLRIVGPGMSAMPPAILSGNSNNTSGLDVSGNNSTVTLEGLLLYADLLKMHNAIDCNASGDNLMLTLKGCKVADSAAGINSTGCNLTLTGSTVSGHKGDGLTVATRPGQASCTLVVTQSTIEDNMALGIDVTTGNVITTISRSYVAKNSTGGMSLGGSSHYTIVNNFIVKNGDTAAALSTKNVGIFMFNTVANNTSGNGNGAGLDCGGVSKPIIASIVANNMPMNGTQFTVTCQLTAVAVGTTDTTVDPGAIKFDPAFVSVVKGDYHLISTAVMNPNPNKNCCIDKVSPTGDVMNPVGGKVANLPIEDYYGTTRPIGAGYDVGAHEVE